MGKMFSGQFAQKSHHFLRVLPHSQNLLIPGGTSHANHISVPKFANFLSIITKLTLSLCYSSMRTESETTMNVCNLGRPYEVVVAATRDMGIGKDGKLPWNLPSDLRFFKDVTTTTSAAGKRNAVIMGRRTWESIPGKYQPLPGRLNVVLTRSGMLEAARLKDLVICSDLPSALKLLAELPHSVSIEKVFVIGGGQVLKEALNGPGCEAIHVTDIETNIECDTFIPHINLSLFSRLYTSVQLVENNIQFSFVTYIRMSRSAEEPSGSDNGAVCDSNTETSKIKVRSFDKRQDDYFYLKRIQETIAGGNVEENKMGD